MAWNIVGCLFKKRLTKGGGGHGHLRIPLATPLARADAEKCADFVVSFQEISIS